MKNWLVSFLILSITLMACSSAHESQEYIFHQDDTGIFIKTDVLDTSSNDRVNISQIVTDENGLWPLCPGKTSDFTIVFSKAKYIDTLIIETDSGNAESLSIECEGAFSYNDLAIPLFTIDKPVNNGTFRLRGGNHYPLKIKRIDLSLKSLKPVNLKKIRFVLSDKNVYIPEKSYSEIRGRYIKNGTLFFQNKESRETNEESILYDLIFYSLNGNKDAENIFLKYNPQQADSGEFVSLLHEGYVETRLHY